MKQVAKKNKQQPIDKLGTLVNKLGRELGEIYSVLAANASELEIIKNNLSGEIGNLRRATNYLYIYGKHQDAIGRRLDELEIENRKLKTRVAELEARAELKYVEPNKDTPA